MRTAQMCVIRPRAMSNADCVAAEVDGDGYGVDGHVDGAEFGAVVVAAVADSFGNLAGAVHVPAGGGGVVVADVQRGL